MFKHSKNFPGINKIKWNGFREIFGVQHSKILIFDDSFIMTGANLMIDYFETEVDRYMLVRNERELTNYMQDFYDILIDMG